MACQPQGKLTLQPGFADQNQDCVNATSVYYSPLNGGHIPLYINGEFEDAFFLQGENDQNGPSLPLSATLHPNNNIYDLYAFLVNDAVVIGSSAAWATPWAATRVSPATMRGSLPMPIMYGGHWVNSAPVTLTYWNGAAYATTLVPQYEALYLGSIYTSGAGQVSSVLKPAPVPGGTGNIIGIWNAYNRKKRKAICIDANPSFNAVVTSGVPTGFDVAAAGGIGNRIGWIDGMGLSDVEAFATANISPYQTGPTAFALGLAYNQGASITGTSQQIAFNGAVGFAATAPAYDSQYGGAGFKFYQWLLESTPLGMTIAAGTNSIMELTVEI